MLDDVLALLNASPLLHGLRVIELVVYGQNAFRAKLRVEVTDSMTFQIWLNHNDRRTRYAYQLFQHDQSLMRWDNAPHHPEQTVNFPHHFHDENGRVTSSPLSGNPVTDLAIALTEVGRYLQRLSPAS